MDAFAGTDGLAEEKTVFDEIAAELTTQLNNNVTPLSSNGRLAKIAIAPFKDEKLPLVPAYGREFNDLLVSSLLNITGKHFKVMSRDSLAALITDMVNIGRMEESGGDAFAALLNNA